MEAVAQQPVSIAIEADQVWLLKMVCSRVR